MNLIEPSVICVICAALSFFMGGLGVRFESRRGHEFAPDWISLGFFWLSVWMAWQLLTP